MIGLWVCGTGGAVDDDGAWNVSCGEDVDEGRHVSFVDVHDDGIVLVWITLGGAQGLRNSFDKASFFSWMTQ